jgi:hypothetical protein
MLIYLDKDVRDGNQTIDFVQHYVMEAIMGQSNPDIMATQIILGGGDN